VEVGGSETQAPGRIGVGAGRGIQADRGAFQVTAKARQAWVRRYLLALSVGFSESDASLHADMEAARVSRG